MPFNCFSDIGDGNGDEAYGFYIGIVRNYKPCKRNPVYYYHGTEEFFVGYL